MDSQSAERASGLRLEFLHHWRGNEYVLPVRGRSPEPQDSRTRIPDRERTLIDVDTVQSDDAPFVAFKFKYFGPSSTPPKPHAAWGGRQFRRGRGQVEARRGQRAPVEESEV